MGSTWSSANFSSSSPSTPHLEVKNVLALCEDADLLLAREKLADPALRVGVEFVVARDIQRMQSGQFPAQRLTSLPPWTSCELLLRHEGALHVVAVGASGLLFIPFEERVASKMPHLHDRFAVRRLRHDARSAALSETLRELAIQLATVAPISWQTLLFPARKPMSPRSPQQQQVDVEATADALKELPPRVRLLLTRMLELFYQRTGAASSQPVTSKPTTCPDDKVLDASAAGFHASLEALGAAEVSARLSAAFVAAVYELVHLVEPITTDSNTPLTPATFWSSCDDPGQLVFTPATALGTEMPLTRPKPAQQNT